MRKILIIGAAVLMFSACKSSDESAVDKAAISDVVLAPVPPTAQSMKLPEIAVVDDYGDQASKTGKPNAIEKKIIKEGELRFKTSDIDATRKALVTSLGKLGGYVSEESENNYDGQKETTLNARIPEKNFDAFLTAVSINAESIDSKNIRMKDVTTEFIDVTTQLANKKKLEARYLELLNKGNKVSDLLEIEDKLTEIRSSIESTQGQLNYLSKQVAYSSLNITFYSKQTSKDSGQTFGYKIKVALASGWYTLVNLFFGFIAWWPIWFLLFAVVYAFRKWRKRKRKE